MHEVGLFVDLNSFTQLILTLFFVSIGLLYFVKRTAAKYFEVGGGSGGFDRDHRRDFMVSDTAECSVCGKATTKKCSRCKSVRYWYVEKIQVCSLLGFLDSDLDVAGDRRVNSFACESFDF
jgi:ubiquitin carboxyl-terminal hydrolase 36/42